MIKRIRLTATREYEVCADDERLVDTTINGMLFDKLSPITVESMSTGSGSVRAVTSAAHRVEPVRGHHDPSRCSVEGCRWLPTCPGNVGRLPAHVAPPCTCHGEGVRCEAHRTYMSGHLMGFTEVGGSELVKRMLEWGWLLSFTTNGDWKPLFRVTAVRRGVLHAHGDEDLGVAIETVYIETVRTNMAGMY